MRPFLQARGFSLTELLVTLFVVAVVVTVGAPSLWKMISDHQIAAKVDRLVADLRLARSEAIKRNADVTVCASDDGQVCGAHWNQGWVVLVASEPKPLSATILAEDSGLKVSGDTAVVFAGDGIVTPRKITLAPNRSNASGSYVINILPSGLVQVERTRQASNQVD